MTGVITLLKSLRPGASDVWGSFAKSLLFKSFICYLKKYITIIGYEPAGLTMHPPPQRRSRVGSFFSHRCLVLPKFFPQRKSGFCRRY